MKANFHVISLIIHCILKYYFVYSMSNILYVLYVCIYVYYVYMYVYYMYVYYIYYSLYVNIGSNFCLSVVS